MTYRIYENGKPVTSVHNTAYNAVSELYETIPLDSLISGFDIVCEQTGETISLTMWLFERTVRK